MLFTALCRNHYRSFLGLLWILTQICYIYGFTVGPIIDTTQLFENNSLPDLYLNITEATVSSKSIKVNNTTNTTNTLENGSRTLISSISVNFRSLFKRKEFRKEKVNLILLPGLALVCFITMVCFRICKWKREDIKFKTRGCSYDVTNFVILAEGDAGYHNVEIASNYDTVNSYASVFNKVPYMTYDTITSYKSLQYRIDTQIFSNVASYSSYLRNPLKKNIPSNFELKAYSPKPKKKKEKSKDSKEDVTDKQPVARKIPGTRFSVVPALDNYMRLRREGVRSVSSSSPNSPSDVTDLSTPGTPSSPRRLARHKVSFTEKSRMRESGYPTKSILLSNKCDRETQVTIPKRKTSRTSSGSVNKSIPECNSCDRNNVEMKDLSTKSKVQNSGDSIQQEGFTDSEISGEQYDSSCKIIVEADVHNKDVGKVLLNNNNLERSTMNETRTTQTKDKTLLTYDRCHEYDLDNEDDESINAEGFKRARLSAPTVNGLIPYLHRRNSEQINNERTSDIRLACKHVKRPRSLSPLLNIKISPKDVQDTSNHKCEHYPRKFSLGTLNGPRTNSSESCLNGHKSFSSIRELLKVPVRSDASSSVISNGHFESSESMSLLSCEDDEIEALNEQVSALV